jgi:hypothetical protein
VPFGPHAGLARSVNVTEATVSSTIVRAAIAIGQPFGQSVGRGEVRLKTFINTLFVCSVLLGGCTHKEPTSPPPADQEKKSDPRATATAKQTLDELGSTPATALDLGLQRLRSEFVPQFDKQLRTQGIFPSLDASSYSANPQFGFVLVRLDRSDDDVRDRVITISVTTPVTGDYASDKRVAELQALENKIVSAVRSSFGGSCAENQKPDVKDHAICTAADDFYNWFEPTSVDGTGQQGNIQYRAAYNLYSLVRVKVSGKLDGMGEHKLVDVTCTGPLIKDDVKCTTSGYP